MNNLYISPEFEVIRVEIKAEVLLSSVEQPSSYVDPDPGDWGDDPIMDPPDDGINW